MFFVFVRLLPCLIANTRLTPGSISLRIRPSASRTMSIGICLIHLKHRGTEDTEFWLGGFGSVALLCELCASVFKNVFDPRAATTHVIPPPLFAACLSLACVFLLFARRVRFFLFRRLSSEWHLVDSIETQRPGDHRVLARCLLICIPTIMWRGGQLIGGCFKHQPKLSPRDTKASRQCETRKGCQRFLNRCREAARGVANTRSAQWALQRVFTGNNKRLNALGLRIELTIIFQPAKSRLRWTRDNFVLITDQP